ncbi:MAG TPA: glycosyltransferase family 1 protein [Gaiellaceae bacterium]|nr:glycosyltransferase family 1 protein [Gaiellaceae bacterium]
MIHLAVDANCLAWGWGGIPKVVDRVVRELVGRDDVRIDLLANTSAPFTDIDGAGQVFRRVKGTALWRETFVARWLERERPSVFWAPESIVPHRLRIPSVVTIHDLASLLIPGVKPARHRLAFRTGVRRSARSATRVVAVSQTTAADATRLYGLAPERVVVVPNGIDSRLTPGSRDAAEALLRQRRGLEAPFVVAVGSLEPRKGLDVLLDAAALAQGRGLPWQVVLAGATAYRGEELAARARATPGCRVLGPVDEDELLALYRAADALVAPSLYEGFGLTPLEALACGTPAVIAGDSGGLVEVAGEAGAVVVATRTAAAWVDGIERARAARAAGAGPAPGTLERYRWPAVAERMLGVLEEAAAAERPR